MSVTAVYCRIYAYCFVCATACKSHYCLLALLADAYNVKGSWLHTVHENLLKLAEADSKLEELRAAPLGDWVRVFRADPKAMMKVITFAIGREEVNYVGLWWPETKKGNCMDARPARRDVIYECEMCSYKCITPQAMSWHRYDKRKLRHAIRKYLHSSVCECCMRDFHSRERAFVHMSASSVVCTEYYRINGVEVEAEKLNALETQAFEQTKQLQREGRRRTFAANAPPLRTVGPLTSQAVALGVRHDCLLTKPPRRIRAAL